MGFCTRNGYFVPFLKDNTLLTCVAVWAFNLGPSLPQQTGWATSSPSIPPPHLYKNPMIHLILSGRTHPEFHTSQIPYKSGWLPWELNVTLTPLLVANVFDAGHQCAPARCQLKRLKVLEGPSGIFAVTSTASSQSAEDWENTFFFMCALA